MHGGDNLVAQHTVRLDKHALRCHVDMDDIWTKSFHRPPKFALCLEELPHVAVWFLNVEDSHAGLFKQRDEIALRAAIADDMAVPRLGAGHVDGNIDMSIGFSAMID